MSIQVLRPGLLTSIQDLGRYGRQKDGVIVSGAMDTFALRAANILVGNVDGEAALEITMLGPKLEFLKDTLIAICGGNLSPSVDGQSISGWRPILVKKGGVLSFGDVQSGCRAYLSVSGGFKVPMVMNSRSTYLRAGIGGFHGRALRKSDVLEVQGPSKISVRRIRHLYNEAGTNRLAVSKWSVSHSILPKYQKNPIVRVIRGAQYDWFTAASIEHFFNKEFQVLLQSDRMGYRLSGPKLELLGHRELISEAVTAGTVQVPSGGDPIVLLADRQTTGGYPKIAQVATVDLPILAQAKPGEKIRFQEIELDVAQMLLRRQESYLQRLKQGVRLKE